MFIDFNNVFNGKPQTQMKLPPAFIDYLNRSVPEGVKYEADEDGNCVIKSEKRSMKIEGFVFNLTKEQLNILGTNYTQKDVISYFYNIQKPLPLKLKKDGYIILNGQEFPVEKMIYNPLVPIKYDEDSFAIYPHPFPKPFPIMMGCDKYNRELLLSRIPNDSVTIAAFASNEDEPLYVKLFVDEKSHRIYMNLSFNLKKVKSIRDIVESTRIYNAFIDGKGTLMGQSLESKLTGDSVKKYDENSAAFWEKVLLIEKYLEVTFCPTDDDIDFDTISLVEQLYQNLINKIPTRDKQIVNSIDANVDEESIGKIIDDLVGKPVFFEYEAKITIELFGVKMELPAFIAVSNSVVSGYIDEKNTKKIFLADENPEKKRHTSIMCFKTEEDLKSYRTSNHDSVIEQFINAKKPQEYL